MDQLDPRLQLHHAALRAAEAAQHMVAPSQALRELWKPERWMFADANQAIHRELVLYLEQAKQLQSLVAGPLSELRASSVLLAEQAKWAKLLAVPKIQHLDASQLLMPVVPAEMWAGTLRDVLTEIESVRLPQMYPDLTDRLLAPYTSYSRISRRTVALIRETDDPKEAAALSAAITLAEAQVTGAVDLLTETVEEPEDAVLENDGLMVPVHPQLLQVQRRELLQARAVPEDADLAFLVTLAPSAELADMARDIVNAIVRCNRQARSLGDDDIFKPTTTFMEAQNNLGWVAVVNRPSLGEFVDCLYLMLYEAAGKDHLRFLEYISKEHCGIIWTLKHLRNKWLRHDPDHGKTAEIAKSHATLRDALENLGLSRQPRVKADFQLIQRNALRQVGELLARLEDALGAREVS